MICGKGRARNDFGSGGESPVYVCVVFGAAARRAVCWEDGRLVQVVFLEDRADISFTKVILNYAIC